MSSIQFQIGENVYAQFVTASVKLTMGALANAFQLTTTIQQVESSRYPIRVNDPCTVFVDGEQVLTGHFEWKQQRYSSDSNTITFGGRSSTGDIVDSSIGSVKEIIGGTTLEDVIRATLAGMNITGVKVTDQIGSILAPFSDSEIVSAEVGAKAWDFLDAYARKRQALLVTNGTGGIDIVRNSGESIQAAIIVDLRNPKNNNVKACSSMLDARETYNTYTAFSQLNPSAPDFGALASAVVSPSGTALDTAVRPGRGLSFQTEESMDAGECLKRASWEANVRRARSQGVSYTLALFRHATDLWRVNRLVPVSDDLADIKSQMLIRDVTFNYSVERGSTTDVLLVPPDSYTLEASRPAKEKKESVLFERWLKNEDEA